MSPGRSVRIRMASPAWMDAALDVEPIASTSRMPATANRLAIVFTLASAPVVSRHRVRPRSPGISPAVRRQRRADDFLVVARVDVAVGVRGVRPVHAHKLTPIAGRRGRLQGECAGY